jgi:DNA repair protein SbcD/Mre11
MIRVLLVADTHIGLDLPLRPRIERRRRGQDFLANLEHALQPAVQGQVDLVVHGGDLFDDAKVSDPIVEMALAPLLAVANCGIPVFLVPGNHERRRIPLRLWTTHPNLHIFHDATTFVHAVGNVRVALSGFPSGRQVRNEFVELTKRTGGESAQADVRLLCLHAAVEGAQVGVQNYTFRYTPDVIRGRDIPAAFAAVLSGHIHRHQVLRYDLSGRTLAAPVVYPGSVERTAFAEREEQKGYVLAQFEPSDKETGRLVGIQFVPLPTRPMVSFVLPEEWQRSGALAARLRGQLQQLDPDAVVRIQVQGAVSAETMRILSAASLRSLAPPTLNITVSYPPGTFARMPLEQA